ncbi:MAG TPA: hypothetical protein VL981_00740 [Candidatus Methylacidiphilales bacterium]|nr:hypothetical protein [Candidatus Methylacidiphilales bacterium]
MKAFPSPFLKQKLPAILKIGGWLACFLAASLLRADDLPAPFTIDLPFQANEATPVWLGHPVTPQTVFATLNVPIIPPDPNASLLVTVFFQEEEGGFLRITWQGTQSAQVLSDNFYEGIGMSNQRSLLISPQTMLTEGTLGFQSGGSILNIRRIKLEWLENQNEIVSPQMQDVLVTPQSGITQPAQTLNGQPSQAETAAWHDQIVNVPITDTPLRIEQGVEFSVQLDSIPISARLALKEAGLPLGKHLTVWINQQQAGAIAPAVPDLLSDGFFSEANSPSTYVGWRDGSFYVPVSLLKNGANTLQFSVEDDLPAASDPASSTAPPSPLALKNVVLQLNYPPDQDLSPVPAPQTESITPDMAPSPSSSPNSSTPTGPATP